MGGEHVLSVARTVDPSRHRTLNCISLAVIIRNILSKRSFEEWHFVIPLLESIMANWTLALCHIDTVLHSNVMQCLIPSESWQLVTFSELVSQVECPNSPLLRLSFTS